MKFYKDFDYCDNKLNAIYQGSDCILFYKNGKPHNIKAVAFIASNGFKEYYLDGKFYGNQRKFTKESWRRFVKLQVFL